MEDRKDWAMLPINSKLRLGAATIASGVAMLLGAIPASAAAAVYPAGGGGFTADAEGWQEVDADCNVTALSSCEANGEHDAVNGNPPGGLTAKTTVLLNLAALFESTVVFESPDFTVAQAGSATLHLDRQFAPGGLFTLAPEATYSVSLVDRGTGTPTELIDEALDEGDTTFAGKDAAASVVSGRTYAISIEVETSATAALGLLGGDTNARFDNIALSVEDSGGEGPAGESGAGGGPGAAGSLGVSTALTATELHTLIRRGDPAGATAGGKHVFVRVRCPKRAGGACRITAQGRIRKRVRVTQRRTVRVAKGRTRLVALRVKRRFRDKVAKRKRLLVVQEVRVGKVKTTFARSRALIRRD
jgi:hypothetical protein